MKEHRSQTVFPQINGNKVCCTSSVFFLLVGATKQAADGHLQPLCWVLIWPEEPQLVDLIGFAEMVRHDPIPFSDLTSEQSDVGHHSSVVVEAWVKHQGFKGVVGARDRTGHSKMAGEGDIISSNGARWISPLLRNAKKGSYGGIRSTTALRTVSTLVPSLADIWNKYRLQYGDKKKRRGGEGEQQQELQLTRMHSSRGISKTFSICDSTLSGSAFLRSIYGRCDNLDRE